MFTVTGHQLRHQSALSAGVEGKETIVIHHHDPVFPISTSELLIIIDKNTADNKNST